MALSPFWKPGVVILGTIVVGVGALLWLRSGSGPRDEETPPQIPSRDRGLPKDVDPNNLPYRAPVIKDLPPPPKDDFRPVPPPKDGPPPLPKDAPALPPLPKPPKDVVPHKDFPAVDLEKEHLNKRS
jgi:hypothetical protein